MPMPQSLPAGIRTSRAVVRGAWWSERETRLKFPIISLQLDSRAEPQGNTMKRNLPAAWRLESDLVRTRWWAAAG